MVWFGLASRHAQCSLKKKKRDKGGPLVDALGPQRVNSVDVGDVEERLVPRRVRRQLHQHFVQEDGLHSQRRIPLANEYTLGETEMELDGGTCNRPDISHRLVHAILQVRLGGEDLVGA